MGQYHEPAHGNSPGLKKEKTFPKGGFAREDQDDLIYRKARETLEQMEKLVRRELLKSWGSILERGGAWEKSILKLHPNNFLL